VIIQFGINDSWIDADQGRTEPRLTRGQFRDNLLHIIRTLRRDDRSTSCCSRATGSTPIPTATV
jgi:lysophospholipase L1-like esterase